jgi:hypothetical protein
MTRGADKSASPADVFQSLDPAALVAENQDLVVSEGNSRIHKVLDHGFDLNPGADPTPCKKGLLVPGLVCLLLFWWLKQFYLFITLTA